MHQTRSTIERKISHSRRRVYEKVDGDRAIEIRKTSLGGLFLRILFNFVRHDRFVFQCFQNGHFDTLAIVEFLLDFLT